MDKIDVVILWVDGSDEKWLKRHAKYFGDFEERKERYKDNGELRFLLRSLELNFSECNHIWLITDQQVPSWLDLSNKKITIVDHTEIIPKEFLPTFNSNVIETYVHRIKGLSEKYILMNDDFMLTQKFKESDWFNKQGHPIVRNYVMHFKKHIFTKGYSTRFFPLTPYKLTIINCIRLVALHTERYIYTFPCHILTPCLKSDYKLIIEDTPKYAIHFKHTSEFKFRTPYDIQRYVVPLALCKLGRTEMINVSHRKEGYYDRKIPSVNKLRKNLCICINDTGDVEFGNKLVSTMSKLFPDKSCFEKNEIQDNEKKSPQEFASSNNIRNKETMGLLQNTKNYNIQKPYDYDIALPPKVMTKKRTSYNFVVTNNRYQNLSLNKDYDNDTRLFIISDIHIDLNIKRGLYIGNEFIPALYAQGFNTQKDILIIAGDISNNLESTKSFIDKLEREKIKTVWTLGNHEFATQKINDIGPNQKNENYARTFRNYKYTHLLISINKNRNYYPKNSCLYTYPRFCSIDGLLFIGGLGEFKKDMEKYNSEDYHVFCQDKNFLQNEKSNFKDNIEIVLNQQQKDFPKKRVIVISHAESTSYIPNNILLYIKGHAHKKTSHTIINGVDVIANEIGRGDAIEQWKNNKNKFYIFKIKK